MKPFVILESPYAGDHDEIFDNLLYARAALRDSLNRGEAPFASHLIYPQVLNDVDARERELGISAGLAVGRSAVKTVVYADRGVSAGMWAGINYAEKCGRPVIYRRLYMHDSACAVYGLERCNCDALPKG